MYSLGIDVGTSGIRAVVLDNKQHIQAQTAHPLPASHPFYLDDQIVGYSQDPSNWWKTFENVIFQLAGEFDLQLISHIAIDGTSGTVLLTDEQGQPCSDALMYNDQRAIEQAAFINTKAPADTAAIGTTSGLAKLMWLFKNHSNNNNIRFALNQSDWLTGILLQEFGFSDHNNSLKMGYDAQLKCWPDWVIKLFAQLDIPLEILPQVVLPGDILGTISSSMAQHFGFSKKLNICAGTTDSTAAIIASGAQQVGEAITSLGSTLVMKVISDKPIFNAQYGVYSQPYGEYWLVGGGSNAGGEVLKQFFSLDKIKQLSRQLDNKLSQYSYHPLNLNYYPLMGKGERFPIQDPEFEPRLEPRPKNEVDFFQALLEGLADIELLAYQRLLDLGTPYPKHIISMGGGANNKSWCQIREQKLGVPVTTASMEQAAAGTALLAQTNWSPENKP